MTCIIGLEHKGNVYMGGDSLAGQGTDRKRISFEKVYLRPPFLIGYSTSFRMGQILEWNMEIPKLDNRNRENSIGYMVQHFVPAVRSCLAEYGYTHIENNEESIGELLVGFNGHLFSIHSDLSVLRVNDGYNAIGCGYAYALGALKTIIDKNPDFDPRQTILDALEVAGHFSDVCAPYYVEVLHACY